LLDSLLQETRLQITKISQHEQFQKIAGRIIVCFIFLLG